MIKGIHQKQKDQQRQQHISDTILSQDHSQSDNFQHQNFPNNSIQQPQSQPSYQFPNPPKSSKYRNRRYTKLKQLCKQGYFEQQQIMLKYPSLYYDYVGKYKKYSNGSQFISMSQFLQAQILNSQYRSLLKKQREEQRIRISGNFMQQINQQSNNPQKYKQQQKRQQVEGKDSLNQQYPLSSSQYQFDQQLQSIDQQDLQMLQQSLIDFIYGQFLGGRLPGFDYRQIDEDEGLDDWKLMDQDEEDKYFSQGIQEREEKDIQNNTGIQDF